MKATAASLSLAEVSASSDDRDTLAIWTALLAVGVATPVPRLYLKRVSLAAPRADVRGCGSLPTPRS